MPRNWYALSKALGFRDKIVIASLLTIIAITSAVWVRSIYLNITVPVAEAGGEFAEGIVGQPIYINPLLSQTSEADADLAQLVYGGLFSHSSQGEIVADIADRYEVSDEGKRYRVYLKENVKWHDGMKLAASDVLFTVNALQDPAYKSPLRQSWQGVEVKEIDEKTVEFVLKNPYMGFLENLTVGILPKHIWQDILPEKFSLAEYNLRPIGSGPYKFADFQKDSRGSILLYKLIANKDYHGGMPNIARLTFNFYASEDDMINAFNKKEILGMGGLSSERIGELKNVKSTKVNELVIPRYFAVFFNQTKNAALADDHVRQAISLGTDRGEIIGAVLSGKGSAIASPLLPEMGDFVDQSSHTANVEEAKKILEDNGWKADDSGKRSNGKTELRFQLVTADRPKLVMTAELLKTQWESLGANVELTVVGASDLQQNYIRPREYDSILFGQELSFMPDLYSFWHSSQKRDPGLNLALYENGEVDGLLEAIRTDLDAAGRADKYRKLQEIMIKEGEMPAIFLYSPKYLYVTNTILKGMEASKINAPQKRFVGSERWYVKTDRVLK